MDLKVRLNRQAGVWGLGCKHMDLRVRVARLNGQAGMPCILEARALAGLHDGLLARAELTFSGFVMLLFLRQQWATGQCRRLSLLS